MRVNLTKLIELTPALRCLPLVLDLQLVLLLRVVVVGDFLFQSGDLVLVNLGLESEIVLVAIGLVLYHLDVLGLLDYSLGNQFLVWMLGLS